ncbi:hypothetical protein PLESTB_000893300 [Pleodorina starrii]|uniref:Uncharacterized protein n=1 Tax=Pleodorina starrii TaxID=330485 RepID=A0A9W6BMV7_9CHLO|nr:hypothetical protein PLESTB_000893300 [Pleodorina starrii]GLC67003.1 hypothetical protein PLESTF_000501100 [Pleodorina starrii]
MAACGHIGCHARGPQLLLRFNPVPWTVRPASLGASRRAAATPIAVPAAAAAAAAAGEAGDARDFRSTPPELVPDAAAAAASHRRQLRCLVEGRLPQMVLAQQADLSRSVALCLEVLGIGSSPPEHQSAAARALVALVTHPKLRPAVDNVWVLRRLCRIVQLTDSPTALAAAVEALFAIAEDDATWQGEGALVAEPLRAALSSCVSSATRAAEDLRHSPDPRVTNVADRIALVSVAAAALRPRVLHLLSPSQITEAVQALSTCLAATCSVPDSAGAVGGAVGGGGSGAGGDDEGLLPTVLGALAAVLEYIPAGVDRAQAARAVVSAGAVPALVTAITTKASGAGPAAAAAAAPVEEAHRAAADVLTTGAPTPPESSVRWRLRSGAASDSGSGITPDSAGEQSVSANARWAAFTALESVLVTCMSCAPGAARRATTQALDHGAAEALVQLLLLPAAPPPSNSTTSPASATPPSRVLPEPWCVLRLLLVLARFRSGAVTAAAVGGGAGTAAAARDLLSTPHALTDSTAEALFMLFAELLSTAAAGGPAAAATGGAAAPPVALLTPVQLRQTAPGLVAAALGVLMGTAPGPDWAALLPCARERNLHIPRPPSPVSCSGASGVSGRLKAASAKLAKDSGAAASQQQPQPNGDGGTAARRYPVKLQVAAAKLTGQLLAVAGPAGRDDGGSGSGGGASWREGRLPVAALAAALGQRWLERPGVFEALGDAGVWCLTLSLQLAPPEELWDEERIGFAAPLAGRVKTLLAAESAVSTQLLELAAVTSVSICSGTTTSGGGKGAASSGVGNSRTSGGMAPEAASGKHHGKLTRLHAMRRSHQRRAAVATARAAALDLMSYTLSVVARLQFLYSPPAKRLAVVAGSLNAAVACVAPRRALAGRDGDGVGGRRSGGALLCPSLVGMALVCSADGDADGEECWEEDGKMDSRGTLRSRLKALLGRLTDMMDAVLDAPRAAAPAEPAGGGGGGAIASAGSGGDARRSGSAGAGGGGGGMAGSDLNGSFAGVDLAEMLPVMSAALRVGASAAAVIAEC